MRFLFLAAVAALLVSGPSRAADNWKLLKFPEAGFGVESPVPLTRSTGTYKAAVAGTIPTFIYSGKDGKVTYRVTIIDISKRIPEAVNLFEEAELMVTLTGDVLVNESLGVEPDNLRQYGREIAIDDKHGNRTITSVMYQNGKIYEAESIVPPDGDKTDPAPQRFPDSIIFALSGALRYRDAHR